jgi:hypothetical protein
LSKLKKETEEDIGRSLPGRAGPKRESTTFPLDLQATRLEGFLAVARLLPLYKNEPIIEYGKRPRFDWKDGLIGETTPDRVLVPAVEPVDLTALLAKLQAAEAGAAIPDEGAEPVAPRKFGGLTVFLQIQKGQGVLKMPLSIGESPEDHGGEQTSEDAKHG